jgi:hypothetical protein
MRLIPHTLPGQRDRKDRSGWARLGIGIQLNLNVTTVHLHNAVGYGESQSRAFSQGFRDEKRLEYFFRFACGIPTPVSVPVKRTMFGVPSV